MTFEKVKSLLASQLTIAKDTIKLESKIVEDLGADSLDTVELLTQLEQEFNITIPDEDAEKITTVGSVIDYIQANEA